MSIRTVCGVALFVAILISVAIVVTQCPIQSVEADRSDQPAEKSAALELSAQEQPVVAPDEASHAVAPELADQPNRPFVILVPYGKGGGSHQVAMAMGKALQQVINTQVQVTTVPGSSGAQGLRAYLEMPHDGYAILQNVDILASLYAAGTIEGRFEETLAPLAITQITFSQIYIRSLENRFQDWPSLKAYAQDNPGALRIANVGSELSMERVNMILLEAAEGISIQTETYDRPADRYHALINGEVDLLFEQPGDVHPFLKRNLIKPILTLSKEKPAADPDGEIDLSLAPTLAEVGVDIKPLVRFRGFFIHADAPLEQRLYLEKAMAAAFHTPGFQTFNREKFMHLVDSYRDRAEGLEMFQEAVETYRTIYESLGLL